MNLSTSLTRDSLITSLMRYCASRSRTFEIHFFLWFFFFFLSEITKHESQTDVNRFQFQVRNVQEILLGGGWGVSSVCLVKFRNLLQTLLLGHPVLSKHKPGSRGTCPAEHRFHLVN